MFVNIEAKDAAGNLVATLLTEPVDATGWAETTFRSTYRAYGLETGRIFRPYFS